jgi:hypothetical protein
MKYGKMIFYTAMAACLVLATLGSGPAWGAQAGLDLNDPGRDVARLFPGSTRYKLVSLNIQQAGGQQLMATIEAKMRDKLRGLQERIDAPYDVYVVYEGNKKIGYIHGVDQKGIFGDIQIFLALDLEGRIRKLHIQEMAGEHAGKLRAAAFTDQFTGLTLADLEQYDVGTGKATGKVAAIKNPAPEAERDFKRILRGVKKNLLLMDEFVRMAPELSPLREASL